MITYIQFIEDRKKILKSIFEGKSTNWVNENITYDYFSKKNILTEKDFNFIFKGLNNVKKLDQNQVKLLLYFIEYAYTPVSIMKNYFPQIITPTPELEQRGLVKYYLRYDQKSNSVFATFRGTKTFWELLSGLKFYRIPFDILENKDHFFEWRDKFIKLKEFNPLTVPLLNDKEIEIHKGFLDEANLIYIDFIEKLLRVINPLSKTVKIVLCGHSLGGVLATILGIYLSYKFQNIVEKGRMEISLITANTPPMGNKNFNLLIPYLKIKNYIRLYNYQDFVPFYGYFGTWIENKKFRHLDYMLKKGSSGDKNTDGRFISELIGKTNIWVKDYGKDLDTFLNKESNNKDFNMKYIYHDIFKIKNNVLFI